MQKKFSYALLTTLVSATLMACGGGGSDSNTNTTPVSNNTTPTNNTTTANTSTTPTTTPSTNNQTNPVNGFSQTEFDVEDDNGLLNIQREIYTFAPNGFNFVLTNIFGKNNELTGKNYHVAENFFVEIADNAIPKIDNISINKLNNTDYQVNYSIVGSNNNRLSTSETFREIDISGALSLNQTYRNNVILAFLDDLDDLNRLPRSLTFPQGSVCYATVSETNHTVSYDFESENITRHTTLESFMRDEDIASNAVKRFNVGANNELPMISYLDDGKTEYAILYNGRVYDDVNISPAGTYNYSSLLCTGVNSIAGNYLEQQIRAVYR